MSETQTMISATTFKSLIDSKLGAATVDDATRKALMNLRKALDNDKQLAAQSGDSLRDATFLYECFVYKCQLPD